MTLVPDLFLLSKNALYEVKPKDLQLSFNIFRWPSTWHTIKTNCVNFRLMIQRYAQFWFIRKGSGNSFSTTFCAWYFKKIYSISWPNLIKLPDCFYFLRYWSTCVLQLFVSHVLTSEILKLNLSSWSSPCSTWTKNQDKF